MFRAINLAAIVPVYGALSAILIQDVPCFKMAILAILRSEFSDEILSWSADDLWQEALHYYPARLVIFVGIVTCVF